MTNLRQAAQAVIKAWDNDGSTQTMEDLRAALEQPEQEPVAWMSSDRAWMWSDYSKALAAVAHIPRLTLIPLYTAPPEWPLVKNILDEYGLQAISFVADWKAAQRPWVGLTDGDWEWVADKKETSLDTFAHGAAWAADQLKEKNT